MLLSQETTRWLDEEMSRRIPQRWRQENTYVDDIHTAYHIINIGRDNVTFAGNDQVASRGDAERKEGLGRSLGVGNLTWDFIFHINYYCNTRKTEIHGA